MSRADITNNNTNTTVVLFPKSKDFDRGSIYFIQARLSLIILHKT